ncbi:hypothetical protein CARUB_v10027857mg [Capsella rubella]|uniref:S-protein homolog n=1 Tax=Capsella rubella TaxID=81985 RepID=R0F043_9BRAS|nr:uncharacterized protein LOC17875814 [Capsella rubella]EOA14606.1 hypothetical protein CARUB_v10027857mg [Capsella rubella]
MDILMMVSIMTMMLFSTSEPTRAATLIVSNELQTRGDVPVFVTCHPTPLLYKLVPLGQKLLIEIPTTAGGDNAVDDKKAAGSKVWQPTTCLGTFYSEAHFERHERPYVLYDSDKDATECKNSCFVVVKDDGFYRWNNNKRIWDKVFPIIWY